MRRSGQVFDLERVEVLRGPQGTLFGRNATGGLVQVITAKPTRTLEGYAGATAGSYCQFSSEGAISGPLADSMRARLAFTTNRTDGFIKRAAIRDGGDVDFYAMRGQLEMDVAERGTLRLKAEYLRNDNETAGNTVIPAGVTADGLGFRLAPTQDFWGTGGNGRLPFPCPGCDGLGAFPPGYTGITDRGAGAGQGANINIPLHPGAGHDTYLHALERIILPALARFEPECIIVASGFDANAFDPLSRMLASSETYRLMTRRLKEAANWSWCTKADTPKSMSPFAG